MHVTRAAHFRVNAAVVKSGQRACTRAEHSSEWRQTLWRTWGAQKKLVHSGYRAVGIEPPPNGQPAIRYKKPPRSPKIRQSYLDLSVAECGCWVGVMIRHATVKLGPLHGGQRWNISVVKRVPDRIGQT